MIKSNKADVLILPYYMYTHCEIISQLMLSNCDSNFVRYTIFYLSYNKELDRLNLPFLNAYNYKKVNMIKKNDSSSLFFSFLYLPVLAINSLLIIINIIKLKPKAIVLGTDLGGLYIRILQSLLSTFTKIRFIVIQNTNFLDTTSRKEIEPNFPVFIRLLINFFGLNRIFYFSSDIPGSYLNSSFVLCRDLESQEIIRKSSKNTMVYKSPLLINTKKSFSLNDNTKKTLVYYTEVLDEIFDYNSVIFFYKKLFCSLIGLSNFGFILKVKFHPRENHRIISFLIDNYSDNVDFVFNDCNVEELIVNSDLTIAVSSAILKKSLLLKVNILKIDFDSNLDLIFTEENIDRCILETGNFHYEISDLEYPSEIIENLIIN